MVDHAWVWKRALEVVRTIQEHCKEQFSKQFVLNSLDEVGNLLLDKHELLEMYVQLLKAYILKGEPELELERPLRVLESAILLQCRIAEMKGVSLGAAGIGACGAGKYNWGRKRS